MYEPFIAGMCMSIAENAVVIADKDSSNLSFSEFDFKKLLIYLKKTL